MEILVEVRNLKKHFRMPRGFLHAVDGVSFKLVKGKTLGIVGESGCGKSTLGRTIIHLLESTEGEIIFEGKDITKLNKKNLKQARKNMQMIFQDPFSSLNPRMTIEEIISEPLLIYKTDKLKENIYKQTYRLMEKVGLSCKLAKAYPHELDGGRRQRVGVARALALKPKLIICDEPVSSLDVSMQAQILNLMQDLQDEFKLTYIFITHDLSVVNHISDDILVMYLGKAVEYSSSDELFNYQFHPYTKALLSAVPVPEIRERGKREILKGEVTSPINPTPGCRFASRCAYIENECTIQEQTLEEYIPGHFVACQFVRKINNYNVIGKGNK